jgi:hypothetical protein
MLLSSGHNHGWLIIIYRVPSTPSTSRVTIWKKIKELGAFLLQQSVYLLPDLTETRDASNALKEQIQHVGGECKIMEIASLGEEQEKEVIAGFNSNREEEYIEVLKACKELLQEIAEESQTEDFHYADLDENEKHLQRVRELLDTVIKRDYFQSDLRARAIEMVNQCEKKFAVFSDEVFSREGIVSEDRKTPDLIDTGTKNKQRKTFRRADLITKLREITSSLNRNALKVGNKKVSKLSDQTTLEWDYVENKEGTALEIKVIWNSPADATKKQE